MIFELWMLRASLQKKQKVCQVDEKSVSAGGKICLNSTESIKNCSLPKRYLVSAPLRSAAYLGHPGVTHTLYACVRI